MKPNWRFLWSLIFFIDFLTSYWDLNLFFINGLLLQDATILIPMLSSLSKNKVLLLSLPLVPLSNTVIYINHVLDFSVSLVMLCLFILLDCNCFVVSGFPHGSSGCWSSTRQISAGIGSHITGTHNLCIVMYGQSSIWIQSSWKISGGEVAWKFYCCWFWKADFKNKWVTISLLTALICQCILHHFPVLLLILMCPYVVGISSH